MTKPEVLSPAGDMERLKCAVEYGADAVYLAGKYFGMRASPSNFSDGELAQAVSYCHANGVRVYVTCNTLPRNDELAELPGYLSHLQSIGADALILSDLGVLALAKEYAPKVDIHISTQAGVVNYAAAKAFYEMGARRVVLARELRIDEIGEMRRHLPQDLEIEAFVHGAMCMSFSGRCLLSNYMTGRDANRGDCAQPCRWEYDIVERKRPGEIYTLEQQEKGAFVFNSRDMCLIEHIPELIQAGITSLKLEGRAKSAYYVASVTSAYRRAVDFLRENPGESLPREIVQETEKISHREYSTGFYFGGEPGQTIGNGGYIRRYEVVAVCEGQENGFCRLKQRNRFFKGCTADVLQPGTAPYELEITEMYDQYMHPIDVAPHAEMTVYIKAEQIEPGAFLRVKRRDQ